MEVGLMGLIDEHLEARRMEFLKEQGVSERVEAIASLLGLGVTFAMATEGVEVDTVVDGVQSALRTLGIDQREWMEAADLLEKMVDFK